MGPGRAEGESPRAAIDGALLRQHGPMVVRALRQLGVDPSLVDDAAQDVFLVLHRRMADYEQQRSLVNWLWGIARGVASTYRRSAQRRRRLEDAVLQSTVPTPESSLDDEVARRHARAALGTFLSSLDDDKLAVFVLAEIEGHTGKEIAERLQVNVNTVYARLRAGRQRFEAALAEHRQARMRAKFASLFAWPLGASAKTSMATLSCVFASAVVLPQLASPTVGDPTPAVAPAARRSPIDVASEPRASRHRASVAKEHLEGDLNPVALPEEEEPMKSTTLVAALTLATAAPAVAHAKPKADAPTHRDADDAALVDDNAPTREYIFDNEILDGEVLNPDGTIIPARISPRHGSMITVRPHFMPELIRLGADI